LSETEWYHSQRNHERSLHEFFAIELQSLLCRFLSHSADTYTYEYIIYRWRELVCWRIERETEIIRVRERQYERI
jgi:hypothetical protein